MNRYDKYTKKLVMVVLFLLLFGGVMVFSTSWPYSYRLKGNEIEIIKKHALFVALSIISIFIFSQVNILKLKKYSKIIFILVFLVGFLVYSPIGVNVYNARRWIKVGPLTFMPSDFMKIASIMLMAYIIDKYKNKFTFKNVFFKLQLCI